MLTMRKLYACLATGLLAASLAGCASTTQAFLPETRAEKHDPPQVSEWTRFWAGLLLSDHAKYEGPSGKLHRLPNSCVWTEPCTALQMRGLQPGAQPPPDR